MCLVAATRLSQDDGMTGPQAAAIERYALEHGHGSRTLALGVR